MSIVEVVSMRMQGRDPLTRTSTLYQHLLPHQIRGLVLLPATDTETAIECHLETTSLSSTEGDTASLTEYEALSYTWGPPVEGWSYGEEKILLHSHAVTVGSNLAEALRQFRRPDHLRRLWVDALCINQEDLSERAEQVSMMGQIYAAASSVLVWLGQDDEGCTGAITMAFCEAVDRESPEVGARIASTERDQYVRGWNEWLQHARNALIPVIDLLASVHGVHLDGSLTAEQLRQYVWPALAAFTNRRYFRRRWVLQEIYNGRNHEIAVQCGTTFTTWDILSSAFDFLSITADEDHDPVVATIDFQTPAFNSPYSRDSRVKQSKKAEPIWKDIRSARTLFHLLEAFEDAECSDPKDRIYSVLGFGEGESVLDVDYTKPTAKLWMEFAAALVRENCPSILVEVAARQASLPERDKALPSWVPDISLKVHLPTPTVLYPYNPTAMIDGQDRLQLNARCYGNVEHFNSQPMLKVCDNTLKNALKLVPPWPSGYFEKDHIDRNLAPHAWEDVLQQGDFIVSAALRSPVNFVVLRSVSCNKNIQGDDGVLCTVVGAPYLKLTQKELCEQGEERRFCLV